MKKIFAGLVLATLTFAPSLLTKRGNSVRAFVRSVWSSPRLVADGSAPAPPWLKSPQLPPLVADGGAPPPPWPPQPPLLLADGGAPPPPWPPLGVVLS